MYRNLVVVSRDVVLADCSGPHTKMVYISVIPKGHSSLSYQKVIVICHTKMALQFVTPKGYSNLSCQKGIVICQTKRA